MALPLQKALFRVSVMMRGAESSETGAHGQYPLTLVTAYFELGGKPESPEQGNPYPRWIRNFLPHVRWPLVVFCDEQSLDMLKGARGDKPAVWHVTRPEDFYAYRYLDDLKRLPCRASPGDATIPRKVFVARSLIWHEKHHFLRQALSENPFGSEMLFWCDIGQFRYNPDAPQWSVQQNMFRLFEDIEWPNLEVCRALPQDKVILVNVHRYIISANIFGGAVEPARRWCDAYYRCLEKRRQNGSFTDIEEFVMKSCWRRRRELVYLIPRCFVPFGRNLSRLGYKQYALKSERFPWKYFRLSFRWHFLSSGRFPWKYFFRRIFPGLVQ